MAADLEQNLVAIEEILSRRLAMVEQGSCKTCQFCVRLVKPWGEDTRWCAVQGNVNPMSFSEDWLRDETRRYVCDGGRWDDLESCFAYEPKTSDFTNEEEECQRAAQRQRDYMDALDRADRLRHEIWHVVWGEAAAELASLVKRMRQDARSTA